MIAGHSKTISNHLVTKALLEGRLLALILLVWSIVQLVVFAKTVWIYQIYSEPFEWSNIIWNRFVSWTTGFFFIIMIVFATRYMLYRKWNWWTITLFHLAAVAAISVGMYAVSYLILHPTAIDPRDLIFNFAVELDRLFLIYVIVTSVTYAHHYFLEWTHEKRYGAELKKDLDRHKLSHFDQILQPHILHNTLNALSSVIDKSSVRAQNMICDLSTYLRNSFGHEKPLWHSLQDEIESLNQFLLIQKNRFGDQIHFQSQLEPEVASCKIPRLILQPIVENAIKHGWHGEELHIHISASSECEQVKITICNDGLPIKTIGAHIGDGWMNVVNRLELAYNNNYEFELHNTCNGVECNFHIPHIQ